ncbi:NAD(P)H pyrophosphatase NUDT13, mitochondrial isoform X5 [Haemorhous mexicanus]|uniref:NAD(P)H pyrophosphatase NUDT13, mitochondrial isoform X5 n=1 Tax=Haemorhous mexicanus TaxID=30427 RepID=UPI0028BF3F7B|nr:NAD(P)H pyrophosphatase NUDT13, mitochondrial isoform X5 [Haemorhous mexicanus]
MAAVHQALHRRVSSLACRLHSTYVRKMSFLFPFPCCSETRQVLEKLQEAEQWMEKSVLIGCSDEHRARFALDLGALDKSVIESELQGSFTDLRKALFVVDGKDSPLLASAQSLLRWHDSHQYCSKTGQPTEKNPAGSKRVCHASGVTYYPQVSPVVITLVSDGSRCLLARQPSFPPGMFTALSGFCDLGENVEEAVRREVAEEVGLEVESLRYSASQHWPFPSSSLMIACHALVGAQRAEISLDTLELEEARWFGLEEVVEGLKREPSSSKQDDDSFFCPKKERTELSGGGEGKSKTAHEHFRRPQLMQR